MIFMDEKNRLLLVTAALLALAACTTTFEENRIDYKSASAQPAPSLAVPPDLTQLPGNTRYAVPGGSVSARELQNAGQSASPERTALAAAGDVRMARDGARRWLVVQRSPEQIWDTLRTFWLEHGFVLSRDERQLGLLETDWAENRAKLPQDIIRRTIGRVFDSLYSTGERDRFRTRVERSEDGGSEIHLTHRGMQEVYAGSDKDSTVWQPRAADPELEVEFLRRLMLALGASQEQADGALTAQAAGSQGGSNGVRLENASLHLGEDFDRAWRRVALALDRSGFTVEDRDRSRGIYYVRYVAPGSSGGERGFFARLFSRAPEAGAPQIWQLHIRSADGQSTVTIHDSQGQDAQTAPDAQRIMQLLAQEMR